VAQWRPLHKRITRSDKVLELAHDPFALWLYTALLPETDREGRLNANPVGLAGTVFEGFGYEPAEIERALRELDRVGLVILYRNGRNKHLLQFTKFQEMCRPDSREAKSELPGPDDEGSERASGTLLGDSAKTSGSPPGGAENGPGQAREGGPDASTARPGQATPEPEQLKPGNAVPHANAEDAGELREDSARIPRSRDPLHVHVHVHEQEQEQPPLPPHEPEATSSEEGEDPVPSKAEATQDDLTHYQRRRRDRPPDPLPGSRLATLHPEAWAALTDFRRAIGDVTEGQFTAWAKTVAEHVDEHGEAAVADALRRTLEKTRLKHPFAYYRKVIGQPKSPTGDAADAEYREVTAAEFLEGRWN